MPMIVETIVTTVDGEGKVHIAPLGIIADGRRWILAPFRPSKALDNLSAVPFAVANHTDDVRVYAGCSPAVAIGRPRLRGDALTASGTLPRASVAAGGRRR